MLGVLEHLFYLVWGYAGGRELGQCVAGKKCYFRCLEARRGFATEQIA
jgi:hypothetical protein